MKYLYLVAEKLYSERKPLTAQELIDFNPKGECYSSLFKYSAEDITHHISTNGSVKGYTGEVYGDWFVVDLDGKNVADVAKALYPLLDDLELYKARYYLFFSGNKGFHLYIHKAWLKYDPEDDSRWNEVSKAIAKEIVAEYEHLEPYVDFSNYDAVRIFRYPYSIHNNGKQKILLKYAGEANTMKESLIISKKNYHTVTKDIFKPSNEIVKHEPIFIIDKLSDKKVIEESTIYPDEEDHISYPYGCKICMHRMLNQKDLTGMRHNVALRLMSWWSHTHGYDKDYTRTLLEKWNERLDDPLTPEEIHNIIKYYPGYTYTCKDSIKGKFCSDHCVEFKTKHIDDDYIYVGSDYIDRYRESLKESRDNWIFPNRVFPELRVSPWKPDHGHTIVVVGGSSSGKTTLINNLIWQLDIPVLYFSYDMPGLSFAETFIAMTKTDIYSSEQINKFNQRVKNIVTVSDQTIRAEDLHRYYKTVVSRTNVRPRIVVIDYLQMLPAKGSGATERAINITRKIKTLAKKEKVAVISLSQVPKELAGDANIPLGMNAAKDSGEIVNIADQVWTIWRPDKGRATNKQQAAQTDKTLIVNVAKDKYSIGDWRTELEWGGDYTVRSKVRESK